MRRGGRFVLAVLALGACGDVRETARNEFDPITPGTLVVGAEVPDAGFWEGSPDDVTGGFEFQLAQALADELGLELEVAEVPFPDVVAGRLGPADLALEEVSVTAGRKDVVEFSTPYLTTSPTVVARRDGGDAVELRDLSSAGDLRWAVRAGTTQAQFLGETVRPDEAPLEVDSVDAALEAVDQGAVDAALVDLSDALLAAESNEQLVAVARFDRQEDVAAVLPSGDGENVTAVDEALRRLQADGTIERLVETWLIPAFSADPADLPVIATR